MVEIARRPLAVIADCDFPSTDVERRVLGAAGVDLVVGQCRTEDETIELCAEADGIILQYAPLTRRVIESLQRCRVISRYGVGVDTIDVAAATERGHLGRQRPELQHGRGRGAHARAPPRALSPALRPRRPRPQGRLEHDRRDGTHGPARRPDARADRLRRDRQGRRVPGRALGLRILTYSPRTPAEVTLEYGVEQASLGDLLARADYVSLHCPLTAQTRHIVDATALRQMKPSACLINTARGQLVDQPALVEALRTGTIAGAALDVLEHEPIPPGDPLLGMRNVILTPHSAYFSVRSLEDLQTRAAENVVDVLRGEAPHSAVNKIGSPPR